MTAVRPLRILIETAALLPEATGVDVFILRLVQHLGRVDRTNRYWVVANAEDRDRLTPLLGPTMTLVPIARRNRAARLAVQQGAIPALVRRHAIDVVHSPSFIMPMVRGRAAHVLTVHDMTSFSRPEQHIALRGSAAYRAAVARSVRLSTTVSVPSAHVRDTVLEHLPDTPHRKVAVVPLGVEDRFRPVDTTCVDALRRRLALPAHYVLAVGTIEPRKNLARLVDAFGRRVEAAPHRDEHLVIAGRLGWRYDELLRRVDDPAVRTRVHLVGYVPDDDLPALYAGARAFAYPSLEEGFGFPPLEAMACATPVLAGRGSSLSENLDGAALLVDPLDVGAIAEGLAALLDDPHPQRWRRAGLERAAAFRWEHTARAHLELYETAATIERRGARRSHAPSARAARKETIRCLP
jgi:glycosyltransferase involved in cell wall biosynthesis